MREELLKPRAAEVGTTRQAGFGRRWIIPMRVARIVPSRLFVQAAASGLAAVSPLASRVSLARARHMHAVSARSLGGVQSRIGCGEQIV